MAGERGRRATKAQARRWIAVCRAALADARRTSEDPIDSHDTAMAALGRATARSTT